MIGTYGSSLHRPHTEEELLKARQALTLLKAHRARGETAARMLGACIVGNGELKKANSTAYGHSGSRQANSNYRRVFSQLHEEGREEHKHSFTPTAVPEKDRLSQVNRKYNITSIGEHKPMSNLANLGKHSLGAVNDSSNNEFTPKTFATRAVKRPNIPTQPFSYKAKETTNPSYDKYDNDVDGEDDEDGKPIKQIINEELDMEASTGDATPIAKCQHCSRSFNLKSLQKHEKVCQDRPNKKKRKVFDSKKARIVDEEQKKLEANTAETKPAKKIPKWKLQSAQFRNAIKPTKKGEEPVQVPAELDERALYVQCDTCGRSFNEEAAKRHIPFCANKARLDAIKTGGKNKPQPAKALPLVQNKYGRRK
eukprot:TRINITY_DN1783_c0_g1_i12.p1 TRINITY_DN1783_c0_g1~~TRINITY_DN1783_c0_g1_i12.p1  ORF type:complete len:367 (+),score=93.89 TRINITY_DN1783_c0_g1_i12:205-1305(+)